MTRVKVMKPYDRVIDQLIGTRFYRLRGRENRTTAMYYLRQKRRFNDVLDIGRLGHDDWIFYRKQELRKSDDWSKASWYLF